jgi:hypothetical protein
MKVELDIFSGRENPSWLLKKEQSETLIALMSGSTDSGALPQEPPPLGYRGFCIEYDGATWRAYRGTLSGANICRIDPDRSIERFLLHTLPEKYRALATRVAAEIE